MSLKKILAVAMCATVVSATGAMMASAEDSINFLPASADGITADKAEVTVENGVLKITASEATEVTIPVNQTYDIVDNPNLYVDMTVTGANISFAINATGQETADKNKDYTMKFEGDYGPQFNNATETNGVAPGTYTFNADDPESPNNRLELIGSVRWAVWGGGSQMAEIQEDLGQYTAKEIKIGFKGAGSIEVRELYAGAEAGAPSGGNTDTPATTAGNGDTTAANNGTTTPKKTNPSTGESTAMVASGIVLAVVSAGAVALTMKKKAQ